MTYRIASYNIENMRQLFKKNRFTDESLAKAEAAAATLADSAPHIAGIVEASDRLGDHQYFLDNTPLSPFSFQVAKSNHKRGKQDLVMYYRHPFEVVSMDDNVSFYNDWLEDIDNDSIKEQLHYERRPLEVIFRNTQTGKELLIIVASFKSKGVFLTTDIHQYEYLALANRKKLYGQAKKVRERIDCLLDASPDLPFIVMGDLNDEPGLDHFEKILGASAVETITGNIYYPQKILHNTLWHYKESGREKELWTTEYPDRIVANFSMHRAWLDHIFVSPAMLRDTSPIRLVKDSGAISEKTDTAKLASDHFPIYCDIEM
ncbi:MAG: endonuclease/exonuclease/phosphatase family protein [Deltaproteobacteria bacterium]|nr:endonuclease/exonuclease/phosphatase family protein [Deltaproteobacteria bacterium]MBN2672184.1 endonuclease/exonuclease/phosphatase family protein [Deltaproteobacteria bacterium]